MYLETWNVQGLKNYQGPGRIEVRYKHLYENRKETQ